MNRVRYNLLYLHRERYNRTRSLKQNKTMKTLYSTAATATGGRDGNVKSEDGVLDLQVRIPKEMGGTGGFFTNPEQLFAAGYSACFDSALNLVARQEKVRLKESHVTARISIGLDAEGKFGLSAAMEVRLPGIETSVAEKLVQMAHEVCPYSKATRGNIEVTLTVVKNEN
jgi:lipoyl-dependent peroxiredoxin